ncbi:MAG TPA: hypothetical protein VG604_04520 [Candidatus Saccharimonadales bacterium]|nr:hypothetical protein [Candidatus Saccharimonadales bacterium]
MNEKQASSKTAKQQAMILLGQLLQVRVMLFFVFVGLVYGYTIVKMNNLSDVNPSSSDVTSAVQTSQQSSPRIDQAVVDKIERLKDNSVNVQSLFNQARSNPFQE